MTDKMGPPGHWRKRAYPWYAATLFMLVYLCSAVDRMVISVVTEPLKMEFSLSDAEIGLLAGLAFSGPFALAALPIGLLVDRFNRVAVLCGTMTVWSVATMLGAIPLGYHFLVGCRMLVGASESGAHPACLSLIADYFQPNRRASAVALFAIGPALASFIIYIVGGWVLREFSWHAVFLLAGIPGLILVVILATTLRDPPRGRYDKREAAAASDPEKKLSVRETARLIYRTKPMLHAIMAHMLATGVQWAIVSWIVSLLVRVHGMDIADAAIAVGISMGTFQTLGGIIAGPLVDWYGKGESQGIAKWLMFASIVSLAAAMAMLFAPTTNLAIAALCFQTFCAGTINGPSYTLLVSTAPSRARGSSISLARLMGTLIGNSSLGFLAGYVSDITGGQNSIRTGLAVACLALLWASLHYYLSRRAAIREDMELAVPAAA